MKDAQVIYDTQGVDFSNPGNNPVTLPAQGLRGRFVRVTMLKIQPSTRVDFALSELEVYSDNKNVARGKQVISSGDRPRDALRPLSLLTDGHVSYGRLLELPVWLAQWEQRQTLMRDIAELEEQGINLRRLAMQRAVSLAILGSLVIGTGLILASIRSRRRQAREQEALRNQLARDMHDEIGSNLAGMAVISELPVHDPEDWKEINRIAHETTDAMREVLWLVGARQESGINLTEQMQRVAKRLLPNHAVIWKVFATDLPNSWSVESRRQVFLFFKEALTNIQRHAKATQVNLSTQITGSTFELIIQDNGHGFDPATTSAGMGLGSLRERAKQLSGTFALDSSHVGTTLTLRVPLAAKIRHSSF
jgi:signal transduction histidine kinase